MKTSRCTSTLQGVILEMNGLWLTRRDIAAPLRGGLRMILSNLHSVWLNPWGIPGRLTGVHHYWGTWPTRPILASPLVPPEWVLLDSPGTGLSLDQVSAQSFWSSPHPCRSSEPSEPLSDARGCVSGLCAAHMLSDSPSACICCMGYRFPRKVWTCRLLLRDTDEEATYIPPGGHL